MRFGVFIHRTDSVYDDTLAEKYQFPEMYLSRMRLLVGNWIIYYEPKKVINTKGYFAIAQVQQIISYPHFSKMHIAIIEPGTYLDFANHVPLSDAGGYAEKGLLNDSDNISGRAQAAVRQISLTDFSSIISRGLDIEKSFLPRDAVAIQNEGLDEEQSPFIFELGRARTEILTLRALRDPVFRRVVLRAYGERCAVTGLKLINGGGRAEATAAHIRPVAHQGPDIITNGIALSATAHWMFDRGLIGLTDDLQIIVSRHVNDRETIDGLINKTGRLIAPNSRVDRPHPQFVQWHRENCFKH